MPAQGGCFLADPLGVHRYLRTAIMVNERDDRHLPDFAYHLSSSRRSIRLSECVTAVPAKALVMANYRTTRRAHPGELRPAGLTESRVSAVGCMALNADSGHRKESTSTSLGPSTARFGMER